MAYLTYINLSDEFVAGLKAYFHKREIPLDEVVEVFAGNGQLGLQLGLKEYCNISDSLLYATDGYEDFVNLNWDKEPYGVAVETAYETVIRFHAEPDLNIQVLIMGAPLPANSYYCQTYETAKAYHHLFGNEILYIGEMNSLVFASPKFFKHVELVEDDREQSFYNLVYRNYDHTQGFFTSKLFEKPVEVHPYLLKFVPCQDPECDCRDDSNIQKDVQKYAVSIGK